MKVLTAALLLITLQCSCSLSPTDCDAAKPVAEKALDLINKERRNGYLFQLLRVADAHLDRVGSATVYYLALDVKESDCWVLSRQHMDDCTTPPSKRPSDTVIGQCKVIATRHSNKSLDLRVNDFNCTTSSVASALSNTKDSPVLIDFFEDTKLYRKQADKALDKYKRENSNFAFFRVDKVERVARVRGGEGTGYYVDFSVRNCSTNLLPRPPKVFGFCTADLFYDVEASDLETPEDLSVHCNVFNFQDHRNISGVRPHWVHPYHFGKHAAAGEPNGSRGHHHPHKPHRFGCPPPTEGKDNSDRPPCQEGAPPQLPHSVSRCYYPPFGTNGTHRLPHNHSSSEHHPHREHPHGHYPHGHYPHKHYPHGTHSPGHHPKRHHPHGHHPHRHHPHGHDFHDYGPCDPPPHSQGIHDHHHHGHGPPYSHSGERGLGKGYFPFHWRQIGHIYRLPPLNIGEVLPLPEANFPSFSLPNCHNPLQPEIQPFPQLTSESCPGKFKSDFPQVFKFFV